MSVPVDLVFLDLTPTEHRLLLFLLSKGRKGRWKGLGRTTLDSSIGIRLDLPRQQINKASVALRKRGLVHKYIDDKNQEELAVQYDVLGSMLKEARRRADIRAAFGDHWEYVGQHVEEPYARYEHHLAAVTDKYPLQNANWYRKQAVAHTVVEANEHDERLNEHNERLKEARQRRDAEARS